LLPALGAYLLLPGIAGAAQPEDIEALMALLGRVQRVEVAYQETVESSLVETAISARGRLVYEAPDRMSRISDRGDGFELAGQRMRLIRNGSVVTELDISDIAALEALVGALRACFAGDLTTLEAGYRLDYAPRAQDWQLRLEPRQGSVFGLLRRIVLRGAGANIHAIEVLEADGDRRTLRLDVLAREPARLD
jgi:outer membrane lipoprotein-sorting protein